MSLVIEGRTLLGMRPERVNEWLMGQGLEEDGAFTLKLDDGEHPCTVQRAVYSTFCWNFQRIWPKTPLEKRHVLLYPDRITSNAHLQLMKHSYWDTFDIYLEAGEELDLEYLDLIGCKSANAIYNYAVNELQEWVETLSLDDYVDVVESPLIKHELDTVEPSRRGVSNCHDNIGRLLMTSDDLEKNTLSEFCRSKFISLGQVLQCIGPKGYPTEISSEYFRHPILNSFLTGLNTLYESAAESRSATKAMYYSKDHVEKGEYFQRKMQLGAFPVARLFKGDCGSTKYLQITMREDLLYAFAGKYMLVPETGKLKAIWKDSRELIGQTILLRSSIHCQRFHEHGVCQTCFGYLGHSIVRNSNLGHISSSELCKDASQALLAVKHSDATVDIADVALGDLEQLFLTPSADEEVADLRLLYNPELHNLRIAIDERYVRNLHDIKVVDDLSKLTLSNTTSMYSMQLWYVDEDGFDQVQRLTVANGSRQASFTLQALEYIRKTGWTISEGMVVVDMKDWEFEDSLLSLPVQHANMLEYINDVETFTRSSGKGSGDGARDRLVNYETLDEGLLMMNKMVSSKLSVNIAHQEIVISCMTAISEDDSRFPRMPSEGVIRPYEDLIRDRSLAGTLSYEHLERIYGNPRTYLNQNRCYHPMDALHANIPEGMTVL